MWSYYTPQFNYERIFFELQLSSKVLEALVMKSYWIYNLNMKQSNRKVNRAVHKSFLRIRCIAFPSFNPLLMKVRKTRGIAPWKPASRHRKCVWDVRAESIQATITVHQCDLHRKWGVLKVVSQDEVKFLAFSKASAVKNLLTRIRQSLAVSFFSPGEVRKTKSHSYTAHLFYPDTVNVLERKFNMVRCRKILPGLFRTRIDF